jgi:hypothetical protein
MGTSNGSPWDEEETKKLAEEKLKKNSSAVECKDYLQISWCLAFNHVTD